MGPGPHGRGLRSLQLVLDRGEREDWFESPAIAALSVVAIAALAAFLIRELTTGDPILDLTVFGTATSPPVSH